MKPASRRAFRTVRAVLKSIRRRKIRCSRSKLYFDIAVGLLPRQPDGSILLTDFRDYLLWHVGRRRDPAVVERERQRLLVQIERIKASTARLERQNERLERRLARAGRGEVRLPKPDAALERFDRTLKRQQYELFHDWERDIVRECLSIEHRGYGMRKRKRKP